jgi:PAS domain S-box-containing protein
MDLNDLRALFSPPGDPSLLTTGTYDPWLVALSIAVAIFASGMALRLAAHAGAQRNRALRSIALVSGSLSLGAGVWAMHFIGMLAFRICAVSYDPAITLWSLLPSIAASALALWLIGRRDMRPWQLVGGGVAVGAGIGAMHYTGMAAMRMPVVLRYDPGIFALSLVVAVVLAMLALWVRFGLRRSALEWSDRQRSAMSAIVMGLAIAGMHYTGMAAARFVGHVTPGSATNATFLALATSGIAITFTMLVMITNGALRNRDMVRRLREREAQWRALVSSAADGVIIFSTNGTIGECNLSAEQIFGRSRQQIVGQNIHTLISGTESLATGEAVALRPDGTVLPIRLSIGARRPEQLDLLVCFVTDISERQRMEQALRDSERQLRSLIDNIPGISYRCLTQGDWPAVFVSDAVERLSGYPASDFVGPGSRRRFIDLVHVDDRAELRSRVEQAMRDSKPYVLEYRITHRDGRERFMWGSGSPVLDSQGRPRYLDGVILDLTERRQMEQDLRAAKERAEQAAAARAAFLANMSHEIRTPMNSIIGFSEVLLQGSVTPEQRRHLTTVSGAARSLLRLLNEILDTAKLDKGLVELELRTIDLLDLVDEVSSTLGASARDKGLELHIHFQSGLPRRYRGDALRIRQVLTNLISNAVKFTVRGSITLEVRGLDGQVHFMVRDTGIGIAADRLQAIFDPFTQADPSMSRRYGGTGLGTTISKQLVELMGGRIWVESMLGAGSCFHVLLPLAATEGSLDQTSRHRQMVQLPPLRILAADDAPQNLELLTLLLGAQGHTIVPAHNGAMAAQLAAEQHFDLVLMDVQMPDMDGLAATREIRAQEAARAGRRVPVIALSASVLSNDRRAALEAGMDAFASKPVDMAELSVEIAALLGLQQPDRSSQRRAPPGAQLLDAQQGLSRWGRQLEPYLRALRHFTVEYAKLPTLLSSYSAFGGTVEARSLAHRVKGTAANLGLEALAALLDEFERLVTGAAADAVPPLLARLRHLLYDTFAAIDIELAKSPVSSGVGRPTQEFDPSKVQALSRKISADFQRGELDSAAFTQLLAALGGYVEEARLDELQRIVDEFDFALAAERLRELCAEFELPLSAAQA